MDGAIRLSSSGCSPRQKSVRGGKEKQGSEKKTKKEEIRELSRVHTEKGGRGQFKWQKTVGKPGEKATKEGPQEREVETHL